MQRFDELAAARAIESLGFCEANRKLARYWLSLWKDGMPPARAALQPSRMKDLLAGLAIFDARADGVVICRLAGSAIVMGLGMDPTGLDVIAITPPEHRTQRLDRYRRVLDGAISRCVKPHTTRHGSTILAEDIQLPLGGESADGARQILYHVDWRPSTMDRSTGEIIDGLDTGRDEVLPITRAA